MSLATIQRQVIACQACPRLRSYCQKVAETKKRAFAADDYWARPVPGFGDPNARLLIVGLAPAAHGANRTGRMFTGDGTDGMGSSDFLTRALHRAGFANQVTSRQRDDGLALKDAYLTAIVRCAPPDNKPTPQEIAQCSTFVARELEWMPQVRVIVSLGKLSFDQVLRILANRGAAIPRPRPDFGHRAVVDLGPKFPKLVGSYHPSRQNTQTGKLTETMFDELFQTARKLI